MVHDDRRLEAVGASRRGVYWSALVVNAALGIGLVAAAVRMLAAAEGAAWGPTASAGALAGGTVWLVVTWSFHRNYLRVRRPDPRRVTVEHVGGQPAVVIGWRTTFHRQPLFVAVVVVLAAGWCLLALVRAGHWAWWVPVLVVVPLLLALPDELLQLVRPVRLVLTPQGLGATGLDSDTWLDWDDVQEVRVEQADQWAVVRVVAAPWPASWSVRRRARFLSAPAPDLPCVEVPGPAFPVDARRVVAAVEHYRATPAARAELAGEAGRRRLLGEPGAHDRA